MALRSSDGVGEALSKTHYHRKWGTTGEPVILWVRGSGGCLALTYSCRGDTDDHYFEGFLAWCSTLMDGRSAI
ncbi:hypothetical protein [Mesorhizobium sp. M8A.F.Ca.ET.165.01.1.1]|uniref:hypothetical protein n=1 Tax=Mesorhizobium sp. M8A.F.Ca.ET.165.01.1.1 TaxID=2563960 RepID=UPI0010933FE6|nr:hypothetical protein [Mesorhizobium sp. M8A.F.Ca.ET.165.01.1.1]TGT46496.1 hypothetical protein EN808_04225 [Mesorhizobium sp. M8A.F.Ca.ET.165.01.1.1]